MLFYGISRGIDRSSYSRHTRLGHLLFRLPKILPSVCSNVDIGDIPEYCELPRHRVDGIDDDPEFASRLDRYNNMYMFSPAQNRHRIDRLRSKGITRYLGRFSILLEKGHMMCLNENGKAIEQADTVTVGSLSYDGTCFERDEECQDPPRCDDSII